MTRSSTTLALLTFALALAGCGDGTSGSDAGSGGGGTDAPSTPPPSGCAASAITLIDLVNAYRAENGLPAIPASSSLCTVAATHTRDLAEHHPDTGSCNLHSWSDQGSWTPCCYTPDHAQATCMWNKPRELSSYPGNGYENAFAGSDDPATALEAWKHSAGHNAVILNQDIWADHPWGALGADIHGGYAVLWFGEEPDPAR